MNRYKWSCLLCALVFIVLLVPSGLRAGEMDYTVQKGQSLSLICRDAYGDKGLYTLVAFYNGKDDPRKLSVGETIRLPFSEMVTLRSGESLSSLAGRFWKDAKKYPIMAWANDIRDPAVVPAGTRIAVPVLVPYRIRPGESISTVAERFYGDPKQYPPIMTASGIEDPGHVSAGTLLKIPYLFPKPAVQKTPVKRKVRQPPPVDKKALALLDQAEAAYRAGNYGDAWTAGHEASKGLDGRQKARALRLTAACQYAFRRMEAASEDLKEAYELDPDFRPDPAYVNPEMMALYERARGK
jgi:LysM repeat protein